MMRRTNALSISGILFMAIGIACAAAPRAALAQGAGKQLTEAQALDLQKQFLHATAIGDAAAIGRMMADNATFIHGNAILQNKAEFLDMLGTGPYEINKFESTDLKATLFDGGAVVTALAEVGMVPRPGVTGMSPLTVHMRIAAVWVRTSKGWQLILQQGTPLPEPAPAK